MGLYVISMLQLWISHGCYVPPDAHDVYHPHQGFPKTRPCTTRGWKRWVQVESARADVFVGLDRGKKTNLQIFLGMFCDKPNYGKKTIFFGDFDKTINSGFWGCFVVDSLWLMMKFNGIYHGIMVVNGDEWCFWCPRMRLKHGLWKLGGTPPIVISSDTFLWYLPIKRPFGVY